MIRKGLVMRQKPKGNENQIPLPFTLGRTTVQEPQERCVKVIDFKKQIGALGQSRSR